MNSNNAKDYLSFVIALSEGKVIQKTFAPDRWCDVTELNCMEPPSYYRVKPEPKVLYFIEDFVQSDTQENLHRLKHVYPSSKILKFVEDTSFISPD